jgi:hypothetical protein
VHVCVYMCARLCVHMCTFVCTCVHVCVYLCAPLCVCVCVRLLFCIRVICQGHYDDLRGLAVIPRAADTPQLADVITAGLDGIICRFHSERRESVTKTVMKVGVAIVYTAFQMS